MHSVTLHSPPPVQSNGHSPGTPQLIIPKTSPFRHCTYCTVLFPLTATAVWPWDFRTSRKKQDQACKAHVSRNPILQSDGLGRHYCSLTSSPNDSRCTELWFHQLCFHCPRTPYNTIQSHPVLRPPDTTIMPSRGVFHPCPVDCDPTADGLCNVDGSNGFLLLLCYDAILLS